MAYVVVAAWRARAGEAERVGELIGAMTPLSRAEPACRVYQAHRSIDDPQLFLLYEQYDDEAGYQAHLRTAHFKRYVRDDAMARLESRERTFYLTLD